VNARFESSLSFNQAAFRRDDHWVQQPDFRNAMRESRYVAEVASVTEAELYLINVHLGNRGESGLERCR
jgi:hypothetical protein